MSERQPRRARKQWREGAPDYVVDCFDDPKYADRYTVFVLPAEQGAVLFFGAFNDGGTYCGEMKLHEAAAYRYRTGHQRIKWLDLPNKVRASVTYRMEKE